MAALPQKLGIVAGGGLLPAKLHAFCTSRNIDHLVIGFEGHADPAIANRLMRIGEAGKIMSVFRDGGYKDLVLIGSVKRPKLSEMRPDLRTAAFFAKLGFRALGDDGLLKAVRSELEDEGFIIHGIHELMGDLLMPVGVLTQRAPTDEEYEAIHTGITDARYLGEKDIGQSVVVCGNDILGSEDEDGTDALIKRAGAAGAILAKASKPQQDRSLDLPAIGSNTVRLCASLGMAGIAAESGSVLVADREEMIAEADRLGLFVIGV